MIHISINSIIPLNKFCFRHHFHANVPLLFSTSGSKCPCRQSVASGHNTRLSRADTSAGRCCYLLVFRRASVDDGRRLDRPVSSSSSFTDGRSRTTRVPVLWGGRKRCGRRHIEQLNFASSDDIGYVSPTARPQQPHCHRCRYRTPESGRVAHTSDALGGRRPADVQGSCGGCRSCRASWPDSTVASNKFASSGRIQYVIVIRSSRRSRYGI